MEDLAAAVIAAAEEHVRTCLQADQPPSCCRSRRLTTSASLSVEMC
jgi:hypothetical protein